MQNTINHLYLLYQLLLGGLKVSDFFWHCCCSKRSRGLQAFLQSYKETDFFAGILQSCLSISSTPTLISWLWHLLAAAITTRYHIEELSCSDSSEEARCHLFTDVFTIHLCLKWYLNSLCRNSLQLMVLWQQISMTAVEIRSCPLSIHLQL